MNPHDFTFALADSRKNILTSVISSILLQPCISVLPNYTLPFLLLCFLSFLMSSSVLSLSHLKLLSRICIPANHFLGFSSSSILQVVTLVVERESINRCRVSLNADTSSSVSNQSLSPATSPLKSNSCSSSSTPSNTDRTRHYSFVTNGKRPKLRLRLIYTYSTKYIEVSEQTKISFWEPLRIYSRSLCALPNCP